LLVLDETDQIRFLDRWFDLCDPWRVNIHHGFIFTKLPILSIRYLSPLLPVP
jgi:hypothetical protein